MGWGILSEAGEKAGRKTQTRRPEGEMAFVRWFGEVGRLAERRGRVQGQVQRPGGGRKRPSWVAEITDGWSEWLEGSESQEEGRRGMKSEMRGGHRSCKEACGPSLALGLLL